VPRVPRSRDRVTGREHEAQEVVAHVIVDYGMKSGRPSLRYQARDRSSSCLRSMRVFRRKRSIARCLAVVMSQAPGLSGTPDFRPLLERGDESILRKVLGQADIADDSRQPGQ